MPRPLNNVTTAATYTVANTCIFAPSVRSFGMIVTGTAGIFYRIAVDTGRGLQAEAESYGPETYCPPSRLAFDETDSYGLGGNGGLVAIKVRSAVAATPAQVTVQG